MKVLIILVWIYSTSCGTTMGNKEEKREIYSAVRHNKFRPSHETVGWNSGYGSSGLSSDGKIGISTFRQNGFSGFNGDREGQDDLSHHVTPIPIHHQTPGVITKVIEIPIPVHITRTVKIPHPVPVYIDRPYPININRPVPVYITKIVDVNHVDNRNKQISVGDNNDGYNYDPPAKQWNE